MFMVWHEHQKFWKGRQISDNNGEFFFKYQFYVDFAKQEIVQVSQIEDILSSPPPPSMFCVSREITSQAREMFEITMETQDALNVQDGFMLLQNWVNKMDIKIHNERIFKLVRQSGIDLCTKKILVPPTIK